jgi:nitrogen fixation protein NifU and related proteins
MADAGYSAELRDHLAHPRNAGPMPDADAVGVQANPICGDTLKLMLRVENDRVVNASWQTVGCDPARAASSIATELAVGRTLDEIDAITPEEINAAAGGIPASKMHAASLAAGALHRAVAAYRSRPGG